MYKNTYQFVYCSHIVLAPQYGWEWVAYVVCFVHEYTLTIVYTFTIPLINLANNCTNTNDLRKYIDDRECP